MRSKPTSGRCGTASPQKTSDVGCSCSDLSNDPRHSATAAAALDRATTEGELIYVPSVCRIELTYLIEKSRLPPAARERLVNALDDPATPCQLAPLDRAVADALKLVSR